MAKKRIKTRKPVHDVVKVSDIQMLNGRDRMRDEILGLIEKGELKTYELED